MFVFDWMLPGMDGMAAIRKIREMPDFSAAPVLMLTAKDREMDIVQDLTTVLTTT
ncbi:MAG: response regulator [Clostridium fessum]